MFKKIMMLKGLTLASSLFLSPFIMADPIVADFEATGKVTVTTDLFPYANIDIFPPFDGESAGEFEPLANGFSLAAGAGGAVTAPDYDDVYGEYFTGGIISFFNDTDDAINGMVSFAIEMMARITADTPAEFAYADTLVTIEEFSTGFYFSEFQTQDSVFGSYTPPFDSLIDVSLDLAPHQYVEFWLEISGGGDAGTSREPAPVPEPGSLALFGLGFLVALGRHKRQEA